MKEGLVPLILGTAVTTTGMVMRGIHMKNEGMTKKDMKVAVSSGIVGLGIAHIALGTIDLFQHKN